MNTKEQINEQLN